MRCNQVRRLHHSVTRIYSEPSGGADYGVVPVDVGWMRPVPLLARVSLGLRGIRRIRRGEARCGVVHHGLLCRCDGGGDIGNIGNIHCLFRHGCVDGGLRQVRLSALLGRPVSYGEAEAALVASFSESLELSFTPAEPTAEELGRARTIAGEKFADPSWTGRR